MKIQSNSAAISPATSPLLQADDNSGNYDRKSPVQTTHSASTPHLIINGQGVSVQFATDETTGKTIIRVVDSKNGELVRQIPSEEVLRFVQELSLQKGGILSRSL